MKIIFKYFICCLGVQKAHIYINRIDLFRLFYFVVLLVFTLLRIDFSFVDDIFNCLALTFLLIQTFWSVKSVHAAYDISDYDIHKKYMISKILFVLMNFMKLFLKPKINALIKHDENTLFRYDMYGLIIVDFIWTVLDFYFIVVIYAIFMRAYHRGYKINRYNIAEITKKKLIRAIDIEIYGVQVNKNFTDDEIKMGNLF